MTQLFIHFELSFARMYLGVFMCATVSRLTGSELRQFMCGLGFGVRYEGAESLQKGPQKVPRLSRTLLAQCFSSSTPIAGR